MVTGMYNLYTIILANMEDTFTVVNIVHTAHPRSRYVTLNRCPSCWEIIGTDWDTDVTCTNMIYFEVVR